MNSHDHYEELCALAVTGQASPPDLEDLKAHLESCAACRAFADDLTLLSAQGLSLLAAKRSPAGIPPGMTQRFMARARSEGIEMSRDATSGAPRLIRPLRIAAFSAAAGIVLVLGISQIRKAQLSLPSMAGPKTGPTRVEFASFGSSANQSPVAHAGDAELAQQLAAARTEMNSLTTTLRTQSGELEALRQAKEELASRLTEVERQKETLQSEKGEWGSRLAQLQAELDQSRTEKNASDVSAALQETELRELRKKVDEEADRLREQEELTARGSDVRDLVVARNLHIIDVHDRDGDGKNQRAFGRIFYTEGKSLIFYAYDLADPQKVDARVSFCVWGERMAANKPIRSLGVLHNDDPSDSRWVLTFGDPQVLAQINSVFVTVESGRKAVREPGGRRILFAFLGEKPNHP